MISVSMGVREELCPLQKERNSVALVFGWARWCSTSCSLPCDKIHGLTIQGMLYGIQGNMAWITSFVWKGTYLYYQSPMLPGSYVPQFNIVLTSFNPAC